MGLTQGVGEIRLESPLTDQGLSDPHSCAHGGEKVVVVHGAVEQGNHEQSECVCHALLCRHLGVVEEADHITRTRNENSQSPL